MPNVYANNLEVSGKAVNAQTIAVFPDVCFTPPQTPATPPGVPIPYPSFGMASDTENGTGTVKVGGKEINIKNKSDEKKTTGTEAGSAPKKGIVTSKNTGKKYFHMWSSDVKAEGEPVIRFSDIASHNHASPAGNTPPGPEICRGNPAHFKCEKLGIKPYKDLKCPEGYIKEHTVEVQFFTVAGARDLTLNCCQKYDHDEAPCICMKDSWTKDDNMIGETVDAAEPGWEFEILDDGAKVGTPHYYKSADARNWMSSNPNGSLGDFTDTCVESTVDNIGITPGFKDAVTECLKSANEKYMEDSMNKSNKEVRDTKKCHSTCAWAKDQANLLKKEKQKVAAATGKSVSKVKVKAADVPKSKKSC